MVFMLKMMFLRDFSRAVLCVAALVVPSLSYAAAVGQFTQVEGQVSLLKGGAGQPVLAKVGLAVDVGDAISSGHHSRAQITFTDDTVISIAEQSQIEIKKFLFSQADNQQQGLIHAIRGKLRVIVQHMDPLKKRFEVEAPTAVAAVRGTDFFTLVRSDTLTEFLCLQGKVEVRNVNPAIQGAVTCGGDQVTSVAKDASPAEPRTVSREQMQQMLGESQPSKVKYRSPFDNAARSRPGWSATFWDISSP